MNNVELVGVSLALALDAFAVSTAAGIFLDRMTARHVFRISFHFGLFQFLMPVIGWAAGLSFARQIEHIDHWIAFGLLTAVGAKLIHGARQLSDHWSNDPTRGLLLVTLSIATSIDALAVGLSLWFLRISV